MAKAGKKSKAGGKAAAASKLTSKKTATKKTAVKKAKAKRGSGSVAVRKKSVKQASAVKRTSAQKEARTVSLVGKRAPQGVYESTSGGNAALQDFSGKRVVLYFYPKDNTPGCTLEGQDFKRLHGDFERLNTVILGVSKDSMQSHQKFKMKCGFPFELLVDADESLCKFFDVIKLKNLYGHKFMGIERSTFVLDEEGTVVREWRKVKVDGHAEDVLDFVKTLD